MIENPVLDARLLGGLCPTEASSALEHFGCTLARNEPVVLATLLVIVLAAIALGVRKKRARRRASRGYGPAPFLVFPVDSRRRPGERARTDGGSASAGAARVPSPTASRTAVADRSAPAPAPPRNDSPDPSTRAGTPADWIASAVARPAALEPTASPSPATPSSTEPDGTLQLLPGRLEITSDRGVTGAHKGQREIRFVRVPGMQPEMTFGRAEGDPYRHVQLDAPTASRLHATLRFSGRRWRIRNDSSTNPTRVNGISLDGASTFQELDDGDRIEMGEVSFRFHQPLSTDRLPLRSSWYTDQGRRPANHDAVVVRTLPDGRELATVCDGIGSHTSGRPASHVAIDGLVAALSRGDGLEEAVAAANRAVLAAADHEEDQDVMGTTLVALLRDGSRYSVANVGDSRAYRIGRDGILSLTRDHSFVAEAMADGRMSREEAESSPWRNAVTRHLGSDPAPAVDIFGEFDASEPHLALLCSDGLHSVLDEATILQIAETSQGIKELARELGEEALRRGAEDNVTVAAVAFAEGLKPSSPDRRVRTSGVRHDPVEGSPR
jgi:PPM family protein phosphatase